MNHAGKSLLPHTAILLPGLHGSDKLYSELITQLGIKDSAQSICYPEDIAQSYSSLYQWLTIHVDFTSPKIIIAESFSTPLALRLAANFPDTVRAVICAGGFCSSPISTAFALLPLRPLFMLKPPLMAIQHFLLGEEASEDSVKALQAILHGVPSHIISQRIRSVLALNAADTANIGNTPALLLQAQDDNIIPWETQNQLENHLPSAEVHWLDSPHLLFQTHPKKSAKIIQTFLASI